jgi:hypothetical protein
MVNEEILKALNERNTSQSTFAVTPFTFDYTPYSKERGTSPSSRSKAYNIPKGIEPFEREKKEGRDFSKESLKTAVID